MFGLTGPFFSGEDKVLGFKVGAEGGRGGLGRRVRWTVSILKERFPQF